MCAFLFFYIHNGEKIYEENNGKKDIESEEALFLPNSATVSWK